MSFAYAMQLLVVAFIACEPQACSYGHVHGLHRWTSWWCAAGGLALGSFWFPDGVRINRICFDFMHECSASIGMHQSLPALPCAPRQLFWAVQFLFLCFDKVFGMCAEKQCVQRRAALHNPPKKLLQTLGAF